MSVSKYKYNLGDRVYFSMGHGTNISGWAKIAGCSTEPMEGLGRGWIVEIEDSVNLNRTIYPFTHIVVFDVMIQDPPEKWASQEVVNAVSEASSFKSTTTETAPVNPTEPPPIQGELNL